MAVCPWKLTGGPRHSVIHSPVDVSLQQVRRARNLEAPKALISLNRRDVMLCLTAEVLTGISMLSAEPAQARVSKLEQKRKIMEKLEKIREKARVKKPNVNNPLRQTLVEATLP